MLSKLISFLITANIYLKGKVRNFLNNCQLTSYAVILSIIKFVFREKHEFYSFHTNVIFKDCVFFR